MNQHSVTTPLATTSHVLLVGTVVFLRRCRALARRVWFTTSRLAPQSALGAERIHLAPFQDGLRHRNLRIRVFVKETHERP